MVAHSSCPLPVTQSSGLVNACLHAWDNQGNVVVVFTLDVLSLLMGVMLMWMLLVRITVLLTIFTANRPLVILSITELDKNMSRSCTCHVASSFVLVFPIAVIMTDGSFDVRVVSCSSEAPQTIFTLHSPNEVKLLSAQRIPSLSKFSQEVKKHCSRDSVCGTYVDSQSTIPVCCTRSCARSKLMSLRFLPCARSIRWNFLRTLGRLDFADFWILSGRLQV